MKLLITGSRKLTYEQTERMIILGLAELSKRGHSAPTLILHGGAIGADEHAETWAKSFDIPTEVILPDYTDTNFPGKVAPLIRNTELVKRADVTLALYAPGAWGEGGTADAARKTLRANKPLLATMADSDEFTYVPGKLPIY